jgi:hypothetical protein
MKESSERRSVGRSIRDALRKFSGYTDPEWGELKMIGARHSVGSTISNGGGSSPSKGIIVGRRPFACFLGLLRWRVYVARSAKLFVKGHCR